MFFDWKNENIRYTGRFGATGSSVSATATGACIEFAFAGKTALMQFDVDFSFDPRGHVYIEVDGGARSEATIEKYIRITAAPDKPHTVKVIYKSSVEQQHRWYLPLIGKIAFMGVEADTLLPLAPDTRRTIEFVGDSITEGVLIDPTLRVNPVDQLNRPWQDDVTATYAWLTAEKLGLRPYFMGYGAVGATRPGCGSVPKAAEAYPYNFNGSPVTYPSCDIVVCNHGANDRGNREGYPAEYKALLALLREKNPAAKIVVLTPFCGAFDDVLPALVDEFNRETGDSVVCISSAGWVPAEPLHPLRDGHEIIAEKFAAELAKVI
ncbi:MAG: hypothetical protein IJF67_00415 [Clostridia bacterium]|nr:hypothetical protein [Clostridia bacterium]